MERCGCRVKREITEQRYLSSLRMAVARGPENNIDRDQSGYKWISFRLTITARKVFQNRVVFEKTLVKEENTRAICLRNSLYKKCVQLIIKHPRSL